MRIAINGAGVAGTTLAWWLKHYGHEPVLIEQAPRLRTGGYVIDFWGLGYTVIERMGLLPQVLERGYHMQELRFVDDDSRKAGGFDTEVFDRLLHGRFTTLRRGAMVEIVHDALGGGVETHFGTSIAAVEDRADGCAVVLENGTRFDCDLVVGADGLHSAVRAQCFGPEREYEKFLGYAVAAFEVEGYRPRDELTYIVHATPSHQLARFALRGDRTLFLFVFRSDPESAAPHLSPEDIRALIHAEYGDAGWETPRILEAMAGVDDIYFDRMSQIAMPQWTKGRVALLGDAAAAVSLLAGEGTGLAITEAYVLAGELHRAGGDHAAAFAEYESKLRPFLQKKQEAAANFASSFVPKSEFGLWARNQITRLMAIPGVGSLVMGDTVKDDFDLPDYAD